MEGLYNGKAVEHSEGSMPFLDKLLKYFESEAAIIDTQFMTDPREIPGCEGFKSCIRFNGESILPPLMTDEKRAEMQMWRHQAIMAERRMRARARQKLLERVQSVMNSIDQKHGPKREVENKYENVNTLVLTDKSEACQIEDTQDDISVLNKNELKLSLDNLKEDGKEVENESKNSTSPERQTDNGNKNNTTQSPRTDSGICSRAATSAEMTDAPDEDQTLPEPHLDTMAEITDISSGSENEDEKLEKDKKGPSPKAVTSTSIPYIENIEESKQIMKQSDVLDQPKGVAFRMTQSLKGKESRQVLRASAKSTSSSGTTASSNEMNKTVISKEDTASYHSNDGLLDILPESQEVSPRVNIETQTDKTQASDFEEVITTNKTSDETSNTGKEFIECGTLLSKVDIGAFSDSMDLSDDGDEHNTSAGFICDGDKREITDVDKARPKSAQSVKSPKMLKDARDVKYMPSPTPSSTPDVSRISAPEEGSAGHNESMRSEALRASMDFEPDNNDEKQNDITNDSNSGEPPKCSTRISQVQSVDVNMDSTEKLSNSAVSPVQMSSKSYGDPNSRSSDTLTAQTCSTDLGRYMAYSVDTLISSGTTLPHVGDVPEMEVLPEGEDLTPVPEQDEDLASTQKSETSYAMVDNSTKEGKEEAVCMMEGLRPVRRGSYTLDQPSPALVKSQCTAEEVKNAESCHVHQDSDNEKEVMTVKRNGAEGKVAKKAELNEQSAPSSESRSFKLTSSMEDLKMKVVQRKLEFDEDEEYQQQEIGVPESTNTPAVKETSERQGKEEHLARYLENLSQLPGMKPYKRKVQHTNVGSGKITSTNSTVKDGISDINIVPHDTLEMESTNSQRLSAKFTEQLLNQVQIQDFDMDSLASSNYYQGQENTGNCGVPAGETIQHSVEEEFLNTQLDYFETLRQQLINQQQQQLRTLMVEQQKQQLLFQQEILRQGQSLLQNIQTGTLPIKTHQSLPANIHAGHIYPSQSFSDVSVQSEVQTLPVDLLQHHQQQQLMSQSPWILNSGGLSHLSTEEQLLAQFFNTSHQPQIPFQDSVYNHEQSTTSTKAKHSNQAQKVSFSVDSDQPVSKLSQRTDVPYTSQDTLSGMNSSLNQSDGELDISVVAGVQVPQFPGNVSHTSPRHFPNGTPTAKAQSTPKSALKKTSPRSPGSLGSSPSQRVRISVNEPYISPDLHRKFEKVTAAAKGYLTRRLLKTDKVQHIIQTIKDTAEFALHFQQETPIKQGKYTNQDRHLLERVLSQLTAAMYEIHEVFFELSIPERMLIIAQSRQQEKEKIFKQQPAQQEQKDRRISAATQKAIERRKQAKAAEATVFGEMRPKSAPAQISSPRCDKHADLTGHIRRNYGHLMAKAMKPLQSQHGPVKPAKDNFNKAVAKEHSVMLRHTNVAKRNVTNIASRSVTKPKRTIGSPVSKTSAVGTKPAMKRVIAPVRPKSTAPAWK